MKDSGSYQSSSHMNNYLDTMTVASRYNAKEVKSLSVFDSLWPHELQHARLLCSSPTPGAFSNSYPSSQWCHKIISSSVTPFSSCLQSFPGSESFPMRPILHIRWPNYWSFTIHPSNEYSGMISFRMDWLDLFAVQWTLKSLLQHHSSKASVLQRSFFF